MNMRIIFTFFALFLFVSVRPMNQKRIPIPGAQERVERLAQFDADTEEFLSGSLVDLKANLEARGRSMEQVKKDATEEMAARPESPSKPDLPQLPDQELGLFGGDDATRAGVLIQSLSIRRDLEGARSTQQVGLTPQSVLLPRKKPRPEEQFSSSCLQGGFMLEGWEEDPPEPESPYDSGDILSLDEEFSFVEGQLGKVALANDDDGVFPGFDDFE